MYQVHSRCLKLAVAAAGIVLWASIAVTPASAVEVTFKFDGPVLLASSSQLITALSLPSSPQLKGFFTYESSTVPGADNTTYSGVINSVNLQLGNGALANLTLSPQSGVLPNSIKIEDTLQLSDMYTVTVPISDGNNGPVVGVSPQFVPSFLEIKFVHGPGLFNSNNVPSLGSFLTTATFRMNFLKLGGSEDLTGTVNLTTVPLPPAVLLFGAGIAALIGLGARSRQLKAKEVA